MQRIWIVQPSFPTSRCGGVSLESLRSINSSIPKAGGLANRKRRIEAAQLSFCSQCADAAMGESGLTGPGWCKPAGGGSGGCDPPSAAVRGAAPRQMSMRPTHHARSARGGIVITQTAACHSDTLEAITSTARRIISNSPPSRSDPKATRARRMMRRIVPSDAHGTTLGQPPPKFIQAIYRGPESPAIQFAIRPSTCGDGCSARNWNPCGNEYDRLRG